MSSKTFSLASPDNGCCSIKKAALYRTFMQRGVTLLMFLTIPELLAGETGRVPVIPCIQNSFLRVECDPVASRMIIVNLHDQSVAVRDLDWWMTAQCASSQIQPQFFDTCETKREELRFVKKSADGSLEQSVTASLEPDGCAVHFAFKISNHGTQDIRIKEFGLQGTAFAGCAFSNYWTLDGESDDYETHVSDDDWRTSKNNLLATFGSPGQPKHSLVIGGLCYREFMRQCTISKTAGGLNFKIKAEDPYGKLVKAGTAYVFGDTFYLDALTTNRFEALETYGHALAKANHVHVEVPPIPIVNLWYAQDKRFGGGQFMNNTTGAVWAAADAGRSGFLKYGPVGVRLEPDDYAAPNNAQGWWDDAHFQKYTSGQFVPPYETAAKWCAAMAQNGGVPFIYFQTARRSEDYCKAFPDHMLFNDPFRKRPAPMEWFNDLYWSYDFTDPGFIRHMHSVYASLRHAGVAGVKFDYPLTGWDNMGGFEDPFATTGSAYRSIFQLAYDGLKRGSDVQERLCAAGDLTLGAITTMRIQNDTDKLYPPMITKAGLRWYKNRVAVQYDIDAKNPDHALPTNTIDGVRAMFTMTAVVSGRLELGKYLGEMTPEQRKVISRVVPLYTGGKSARPVDAFEKKSNPEIYDLEINPAWHQLVFYNTKLDGTWPTNWQTIIQPLTNSLLSTDIGVALGAATDEGGLGLDVHKTYHVFDFWNNHYVGKLQGSDELVQHLRPGESRMMSIHEAVNHPQFISTDRHVFQGLLDLKRCDWQPRAKKLMGSSLLVAGEPYTVVLAGNGYRAVSAEAAKASASLSVRPESPELFELVLCSPTGGAINWQVNFEPVAQPATP